MIDTSVAGSPGWWFQRLILKMQARAPRFEVLDAYLDGDAPLPESSADLKDAYKAFQKKARTNFAEIAVEAVAERMTPSGFRVGDAEGLDKTCDLIWSANELDMFANDVHFDMLGLSSGYVIVGDKDSNGIPVITREDPHLIVTEHDPIRPQKVIAALKLYRDHVRAVDVGYLYIPGYVMRAEKQATANSPAWSTPAVTTGYEWVSVERMPFNDVPVVRFKNRRGLGEFETHTDVLDRINFMVLQRLIVAAMQAFRQRAVKGDIPEVETDEHGEPVLDPDTGEPVSVDYAGLFKPGAGALWVLPDGVELWESQVTDITQLLTAVKDDIRDYAAATRTPMSMLLPDGQNQSAEGASFAREGLVFKTIDRMQRASFGWNSVMGLALRYMETPAVDIETLWLPPERLSLAERADAGTKLSAILPRRTLYTEILQFSPEKAEEMETEMLGDILTSALAAPNGV